MIYLLIIVIMIVCVLLIIAILIQNPKGGGLGAGFGGMGNQVMGARRANDFIEKTTWSLVAGMLVLCLVSGVFIKKSATASSAVQDTDVENKFKENSTPLPTAAPNGQRPGGAAQGPQQGPGQQQPQGQQRPGGQPQGGQPQQAQPQQQPAAQPQGGQPK